MGGIYGLCPEGEEINRYQEWLTDCKNDVKKKLGIPKTYPDVVILGGELTEGKNVKTHGEDIYLHMEDQIDGAVKLATEFIGKDTKEVLIPFAHKYHNSMDMRNEYIIRDRLRDRFPKVNIQCGDFFDRTYYDKNFRFVHGSGGGIQRLCSKPESDIRMNLQQSALGKANKIDCSYSYHTHRLAGSMVETIMCYTCPCFKFTDTGGRMKNPDGWLSDIGVMVTTVEELYGSVRIRNDPILYKPDFHIEDLEYNKDNWVKRKPLITQEISRKIKTDRDLVLPNS